MTELKDRLEDVIEDNDNEKVNLYEDPAVEALQKTAVNFSKMALNTFEGDLLKKAINISISIAEFTAEYLKPAN